MIPIITTIFPKLITTSFNKTSVIVHTCHQGALSRALLHKHHVLEQGTMRTMSACSRSRLSQVGGQMATGDERRAEGEGWLQTSILLGRGHLEKTDSREGEG